MLLFQHSTAPLRCTHLTGPDDLAPTDIDGSATRCVWCG